MPRRKKGCWGWGYHLLCNKKLTLTPWLLSYTHFPGKREKECVYLCVCACVKLCAGEKKWRKSENKINGCHHGCGYFPLILIPFLLQMQQTSEKRKLKLRLSKKRKFWPNILVVRMQKCLPRERKKTWDKIIVFLKV
jgi:hypothetical protein